MHRSDRGVMQPSSANGFRDIPWCTRLQDIPWAWSDGGISAPCRIREDEDFDIFDIRAVRLTYTFRHSVFYGVRIDYEDCALNARVLRALLKAYRPLQGITHHGVLDRSWQTEKTSVWVQPASEHDAEGSIFLWGRDRVFPDDEKRPVYMALPPAINSTPGPYVPRQYVCYRASGPITIDGRLDEKAWRDAEWMQLFEDHQAPYAPAPWKTTRAKMLYDDDFVYFGAELQEENVWGSLTERDCVIYYDNDFEIFLNPTSDGVGYYEFEINPLNVVWDMFHETDYHRASALHTDYDVTGLRHAVAVQGTLNYHHDEDIGWTVEVAWPLKSLCERNPRVSLPIERGDMWRVNFSRVQYMHNFDHLFPTKLPDSPCEDWVWQSTSTGDLHNPEMWGKVYFSDRTAGTVRDDELERPPLVYSPSDRPADLPQEMVYLPAGICTIGPDPTDPDRSPAHEVSLDGFWMDRYPVTVAEFTAFLNEADHGRYFNDRMRIPEHCGIVPDGKGKFKVISGRENYPVVYADYDAALAYAESKGKTLPSEVQWEYAARGTEGRTYAWGDEPINPALANYDFNYGGTTPVGSFPEGATPEGLYDMTGNIKEYTTSEFASYPGGEKMVYLGMRAPFIYDKPVKLKVVRGGAWTKQQACMAAAYRDAHGSLNIGFRCIKTT